MTESPWLAVAARAAGIGEAIETDGQLPADLVAELAATGVFKLWVAPDYAGAGASLQAGLDAIEECAYHDGAVGWSVMIANTTALLSSRLPPAGAAVIFGADDAICGGLAAPVGLAVVGDSGVRVSGRWAWGSGSSHATTMGGGVRYVGGDGKATTLPSGSRSGFAFFDRADVTLLDTWQVAGLEATASTDYEVTDAFVPFDHLAALDRREPVVEGPLTRFSTFGALALGVAAVSLGLARRGCDELAALGGKIPQGSGRTLAERPGVQAELARAEGRWRAGAALVREEVDRCWTTVSGGGELADADKVSLRLAANTAMEFAIDAVDRCYHAGGGVAVYRNQPLQRVFRDVHVAAQHAMTAARVYEPIGRARFGLETDTRSL